MPTLQQGYGLVTLLDIDHARRLDVFLERLRRGLSARGRWGEPASISRGCVGWESLKRTRDVATDGGTITLQNVSGNTIDRDVAGIIKGTNSKARYVRRALWKPLADQVKVHIHRATERSEPR
jgi:hypothetical protein